MTNLTDINRVVTRFKTTFSANKDGGNINLTGCLNRYTIGAKNIFTCLVEHFNFDSAFYTHLVTKELTKNYLTNDKVINYDTLGYWVDNGKIYVDLGFRFSDKSDALKFAQFNGELAIWDNEKNQEIIVK